MDGEEFYMLIKKHDIKPRQLGVSYNYIRKICKYGRKPSGKLIHKLETLVAPGGGLEPPTTGLTARRSTH